MRTLIRKLCLSILLIPILPPTLPAQVKILTGYERLTIADGLSNDAIHCIFQDRQGFLWFGTSDGLNRYDGYTFKVFKYDPADSASLSSNEVRSICEDRAGRIWIGTANGLNRFDPNTETFTHYKHDPNDPNSLSSNEITAIHEDHRGNLWIGLRDQLEPGGLNKLVFSDPAKQIDQSQATSFSQNPAKAQKENPAMPRQARRVWGGTAFKVIRYKLNQNDLNNLTANWVTFIMEDPRGSLWIGTENGGLKKFEPAMAQITHYMHNAADMNSLSYQSVVQGCMGQDGVLWLGFWNPGLDRFDPVTGKVIHYRHDPKNSKSLDRHWVGEVYAGRSGILWVGTSLLSQFDRQTEEFTHFAFTSNYHTDISNAVSCLYEDRSNILWLATQNNGLIKLDLRPPKFAHYQHDAGNPNSLGGNNVRSLYEDKSGMIWIAIYDNGVSRFDPRTEQFTHFKHDPKDPSSLGHNSVLTIYEDRSSNLWFGTAAGLDRFDPHTGRITRVRYDKFDENVNHPAQVVTICEDRTGTLWFGTGRGLYKLISGAADRLVTVFDAIETPVRASRQKLGNGAVRFVQYQHDPKNSTSIGGNFIWDIHEDQFGNFWVIANVSLNLMDRQTGKFINVTKEAGVELYYDGRAIYESRSGLLWLTSHMGLARVDFRMEKSASFKIIPPDHFLRRGAFYPSRPHEDRFGMIWTGGEYGLLKLDPVSQKFIAHYSEKDGLAANLLHEIVDDKEGNLWLLTGKGLSIFNENAPPGKQFRNLDSKDGVVNSPTAHKGLLKAKDGTIYWGGSNGLYRFFPRNMKNNPHVPPVVLTEFRVFNEAVKLDSAISAQKQITLGHDQNSFAFSFAALDFTRPLSNQYAHRLEGFDEEWIETGNRRYANYTHIPPGKYTFRVKGSNNDGVWNEAGASVRIIIAPPWWKTWWAYALYVVFIGAALYGIRRFEMNRIYLRNELKLKNFEAQKLQEVDHMKSRFFANISHEFRTPLTLILGPIERWLSKTDNVEMQQDLQMMQRNSRRLLRLIQQLLDLSRLEAGRMSLQTRPQDIVSLLKGLVLSFASLAERQRITLTFEASEDSIIVYLDQDKIEKIVSNLLSNAFKFTPEGGSVAVAVGRSSGCDLHTGATATASAIANFVQISVRDTGMGIPSDHLEKIFDRFYQVDDTHTREHEGTGIGLALTKELVELHHGEIQVNSELQKGTTFIVRLPLGKEHLKPEEISVISEQLSVSDEQSSVSSDQFSVASDQSKRSGDPDLAGQQATSKEQRATSNQPLLLIIEDNADVRHYLRRYLDEDYRILEAENGLEGLEQAAEHMPDLIISDVMMPKIDGFEFCRKIRAEEKTSHIPVILLTARASGESKIAGLETGTDDYVTKPFDAKELQIRVKNLIEQRRRLRERFGREVTLQPHDIVLTSMDEKFLQRAMAIVEEYMADSDFTVELFSHKIGMSRVHLNRKLKALTDHSANDFIRTLRLKRAAQLLQAKSATVLEIAYEVGFNNPSYFAECFRKQFGKSPSQYVPRAEGMAQRAERV